MNDVHLKVPGPLDELSHLLWRERDLLGTLLFKLETERLVRSAARIRWVSRAAHEVDTVLAQLRTTEILRAAAADGAASAAGLEPHPALRDLAGSAHEPWRTILLDHRDAFVGLADEIAELVGQGRGGQPARSIPPSLVEFLA
jgi:hypothetical protein